MMMTIVIPLILIDVRKRERIKTSNAFPTCDERKIYKVANNIDERKIYKIENNIEANRSLEQRVEEQENEDT